MHNVISYNRVAFLMLCFFSFCSDNYLQINFSCLEKGIDFNELLGEQSISICLSPSLSHPLFLTLSLSLSVSLSLSLSLFLSLSVLTLSLSFPCGYAYFHL